MNYIFLEMAINESFMQIIEKILSICIIFVYSIGALVILFGIIFSIINLIINNFDINNNSTKNILLKSFSLGLSYLIGAEILSTILAKSFTEILSLSLLILIRILVGVFVGRELKSEEMKKRQ